MSPEEIAQSYDNLAEFWSSDEYNREYGVPQLQRALRFVKNKGNAIDIGCGSSGKFIEILLGAGFEVEGLDISDVMLSLAKKRFSNVTFHHANIVEWEFSKTFDFISAWDSIWHVPLEDQQLVLEKLCGGLSREGVFMFTSGGTDGPDSRTNPCRGQDLYHAALGIPKLLSIIAEFGCICRHLEYDQAHGNETGEHLYLIVQKP